MAARLDVLVREVERHVAEGGWDQRPKLFALVETADLVRREPALAAQLGLAESVVPPGSLTPVEQDDLGDRPLDEALARIAWPAEVLGCALVHEVVVLPPAAEEQLPADGDPEAWAAAHPDRREVRMAVGVLRDGSRAAALRLRAAGDGSGDDGGGTGEEDVLTGPDLAPGLVAALAATLAD